MSEILKPFFDKTLGTNMDAPLEALRGEEIYPIWGLAVQFSKLVSDAKRASIVEYLIQNNQTKNFGRLYPIYPMRQHGIIYVLFPDIQENEIKEHAFFKKQDKVEELVTFYIEDVLASEDIISLRFLSAGKVRELCEMHNILQCPEGAMQAFEKDNTPPPTLPVQIKDLSPYERVPALANHRRKKNGEIEENLTHWFVEP